MSQTLRTVLSALFVTGLLLSVVVVLTDRFKGDPRYRLDPSDFHVDVPSEMVAADYARESLAESAVGLDGRSIFDSELVPAVRQAFAANPWVSRVRRVSRRYPSQVEIDLALRDPFVAVELDGVYLLADTTGYLLPVETDTPLIEPPILTIRAAGAHGVNPRGLTDVWVAEAVREGTSILLDLYRHSERSIFDVIAIDAIDVSNYGGRLDETAAESVLVTDRFWADPEDGNREKPITVAWGRSTRHARAAIELSIDKKLDHFEQAWNKQPNFHGWMSIDVRFDEAWFRPIRRVEEAASR